ncbi:MAG: glutamine--tRNA ligase/YqeY domain fusion protein [Opitutales bacterium]|nr:glutamine--tRNA ligase/YqeY domain fusion protein [Opitutales bacterium]
MDETPVNPPVNKHFIRQIIDADLASGAVKKVITRFPPEPNGYIHIGHAKAICLDFGMAKEYGGECHLRMDDTNPTREDVEYVESIQEDVRWLGFDWGENYFHASDYFDKIYDYAIQLIKLGKAYVCYLTADEWKEYRGVPEVPGKASPTRDMSVEKTLEEFAKMSRGEYGEGEAVLRAKVDMASPNMHMRDPVIYRVRKVSHHNTGDKWCVYPMYDFAHPLEDAIEGITHSICTLEFEVHRPFYDWVINTLNTPAKPHQYEFARLSLTYTMMSKRRLLELVNEKYVSGWDDPRMPTVCGLRRRGYTPESIRNFCETIGVTKFNSLTEVALLEHAVRSDLNKRSPRAMAVMNPLKVIIDNYEGEELLTATNNPEDPAAGTHQVPFSREIYIEREDFMEDPPKKYFRLAPGREVRLRWAYVVKCVGVEKDADGNVTAVHCTYDPETRGGNTPDGRKIKGTIHWVSCAHGKSVEVRLYDYLFTAKNPSDLPEGVDWRSTLNPDSLVVSQAFVEPSLLDVPAGTRVQFERVGYFCADPDGKPGAPVFNRTVTLKDSFKIA